MLIDDAEGRHQIALDQIGRHALTISIMRKALEEIKKIVDSAVDDEDNILDDQNAFRGRSRVYSKLLDCGLLADSALGGEE